MRQQHTTQTASTAKLTVLLIAALAALLPLFSRAGSAEQGEGSFLPTWKLFNSQEKQHFIAGYIHGWSDAARVVDVAIDYVKDHPDKAIDTLQKVKGVYDMESITPDALSREIDKFYADPDHSDAPLTRAISSAREELH